MDDRDYILGQVTGGDETLDGLLPDLELDNYYYKIIDFNTIVQIDGYYGQARVFTRDSYQRPQD